MLIRGKAEVRVKEWGVERVKCVGRVTGQNWGRCYIFKKEAEKNFE